MWIYLAQGITFGFAAAAQPGVFQTYLISQTLNNGWRRTLPLTFVPLISDIPIILLMLVVLSQMPPWLERSLRLAGGFFLLYLAHSIWIKWRSSRTDEKPATELSNRKNLLQAAMVNLLNPAPYLGWSLVMGPQFLKGWREVPGHGLALVAGFYPTMIICSMAVILIFALTSNFGPKAKKVLPVASALALTLLGIYQLWMGLQT